MPLFDITPGDNPLAPGRLDFGVEGQAPGFSVTSEGVITAAGAGTVNPLAYLAPADVATSDPAILGAALVAALAAAPAGSIVALPPGKTFRGPFTIDKALTLRGGSVVADTGSGVTAITVTASDVTIRDVTITGRQSAALVTGETGIDVVGSSAGAPLTNVKIQGCRIRTFGYDAIRLLLCTRFDVAGNDVGDISYSGIAALSCWDGTIRGNRVTDIVQGTGAINSYGIAVTRNSSVAVGAQPRSRNVVVSGNVVDGVPNWEGIDGHGTQNQTVVGNTVRNCLYGISLVAGSNTVGDEVYGCTGSAVVGNTVDSLGLLGEGIRVVGAFAVSLQEAASGVVSGNVVRNAGAGSLNGAGLQAYYTTGLVVVGNSFYRCTRNAVCLINDNTGYTVVGNSFEDTYASTGIATAVKVASTGNVGHVGGNTYVRGPLTGPASINARGLWVASDLVTSVGPEDYVGVTTAVTGTAALINGAVGAKPSIAGSRGGNAALADLLTKGAAAYLWTDGTS